MLFLGCVFELHFIIIRSGSRVGAVRLVAGAAAVDETMLAAFGRGKSRASESAGGMALSLVREVAC